MKELEKIMEEIETEFEIRINTQLKIISGLNDDVYRYGYGKSLEAYQQGKLLASEIICKHMNDGWIPAEPENIPEEVICCDKYGELLIGRLSNTDLGYVCESEECTMYDVVAWM